MTFKETDRKETSNIKSLFFDLIFSIMLFFFIWFWIDVGVDYIRDWYLGIYTLSREKIIGYIWKDLAIGSLIALTTTCINHFYYKQSYFFGKK